MSDRNTDLWRLKHIQLVIEEANELFGEINYDEFLKQKALIRAAERLIEIIGEASTKISSEIKLKYQNVPWRIIKGMRNIVAHEYFSTDNEIIWNTVKYDIPSLEESISEIINDCK